MKIRFSGWRHIDCFVGTCISEELTTWIITVVQEEQALQRKSDFCIEKENDSSRPVGVVVGVEIMDP